MWDLKSEPAIVDVFAQIWGTNELLASFGTRGFEMYMAYIQMAATSVFHSRIDPQTMRYSSPGPMWTSPPCNRSCTAFRES